MKEEEEEIDIDTIVEDSTHNPQVDNTEIEDEDFAWADQGREDRGDFKVKIIMLDDSEM